MVEDYGFDGLDMHYEIYTSVDESIVYLALLRELRAALNQHAENKQNGHRCLLTAVGSCSVGGRAKLRSKEMDQYLDFWNLLSYALCENGSRGHTANQAALHSWQDEAMNVSLVVKWWIEDGIDREKLVLGISVTLRDVFLTSEGRLQQRSRTERRSTPDTWNDDIIGRCDYRALPLPGHKVYHDEYDVTCWSYHSEHQIMMSYDDETTARVKGEYTAGRDQIDTNSDHHFPGRVLVEGPSLVTTVTNVMGDREYSQNWLDYDRSQFPNMANGMRNWEQDDEGLDEGQYGEQYEDDE
ncbi:glycosyl hydrolases family 18-domain-containing protein [Pterulicium gracile]|uniref:Glycosyl hydrolases family 18-domain-containing protein n=1 Tax=Pterulicium gracile TaxID=1884261 RepID=A0A5C3QD27_9AGAR|nr:glycosyl hydrolases family 18-domain-containing protein [Pterula gracilis]